jgi:hypothetical protein
MVMGSCLERPLTGKDRVIPLMEWFPRDFVMAIT